MSMNDDVTARAQNIRLLLMDCDGVLTDGRILYTFDGAHVNEATKISTEAKVSRFFHFPFSI